MLSVGVLRLYDMQVQNFTYGILFSGGIALSLYDSKLMDNTQGLETYSTTYVHNTVFDHNGSTGALALAGYLSIADSSAQNNGTGFHTLGGTIVLDGDRVTSNVIGMKAEPGASLYFAHCVVSGNGTAYSIASGATLAGSVPGSSLIAPGQIASGALSTATSLQ